MKLKDLIPYLKAESIVIQTKDGKIVKTDRFVRDVHEKINIFEDDILFNKEITSINTIETKIILKI